MSLVSRVILDTILIIAVLMILTAVAMAGPVDRLCDRQSTPDICRERVAAALDVKWEHPLSAVAAGLAWCHQRTARRECSVAVMQYVDTDTSTPGRYWRVIHLGDGDAWSVSVTVPAGAVAVAHTHVRVSGDRGCSDADHRAADRLPIALFVQHRYAEIERCGRE